MQEILIILVVALIVIGPKRLPELARTLGKGLAEFRKAADDLQETVRMDLQKEKQEEFRQKYPDLVPDEDGEETAPQEEDSVEDKTDGEDHSTKSASTPSEIIPEPAPDLQITEPASSKVEEPEPSYNPEEIEGGDETEDDTRDG